MFDYFKQYLPRQVAYDTKLKSGANNSKNCMVAHCCQLKFESSL